MLDRIQRWLSIDTMLPVAERLGAVGTTKQLYGNYLKIALASYITRLDVTIYDCH